MAERIVSPGVFTREKDLSFLPQGIADIGAALIGPTLEGPAFVPTVVNSFGEFEEIFGKETQDFYVPFTAKQYLRSAGTVTIVRVLGLGGYANDTVGLFLTGSIGGTAKESLVSTLKPSRGSENLDLTATALSGSGAQTKSSFTITLDSSDYALSFDSSSANYITKVFSTDAQDSNKDAYVYSNFLHSQNQFGSSA